MELRQSFKNGVRKPDLALCVSKYWRLQDLV